MNYTKKRQNELIANAEKAMRGCNPDKEGFYSDQASTYAIELKRRLK